MGIYDRDYTRQEQPGHQVRITLPRLTPVVKWLIIINVAVFLTTFIISSLRDPVFALFSSYPRDFITAIQPWRLITYQFLHDQENIFHIFFNMIVLYFFGPLLERLWGSKKFLTFYLICGAMGGVVYPILVLSDVLPLFQLVGASGGIYGMLAAAAILMPKLKVYVFGVIPLQLRTFAIILVAISILRFRGGVNAGGEAAHLAGMAAGAAYILWHPQHRKIRVKRKPVEWKKKIHQQRNFQAEIDRILDKVHTQGITSLTRQEKKTLQEATKMQQQQDDL